MCSRAAALKMLVHFKIRVHFPLNKYLLILMLHKEVAR